ncbi:unknown [Firmicutes bacterium CAG:475]|nr:unknown [Firmicutes bacterium CAG:475]
MRKIAKDNIIVVCTIVLCIMLTLALCVSFSEGGLLSVFNKVESKSQTMWAIACKGYSDISTARQSAEMIKSRGGAGYVQSGDEIEIIYAVYKSEEDAKKVLAGLSDKSLYLKRYDISEGSFKWCKEDIKSAVGEALCYFDVFFDGLYDLSNKLNESKISVEEAKIEIKVLQAQIEDIKSAFYQNTANRSEEQITQIKLGLVTSLALLDNVDFSKNDAYATASLRYQLVQGVLCRQALMNCI